MEDESLQGLPPRDLHHAHWLRIQRIRDAHLLHADRLRRPVSEDLAWNLQAFPVFAVFCILFGTFFLSRKNLGRMHSWVKRMTEQTEAREAAGIAALMGKYGVSKTLSVAKNNFRGIDFTCLNEIDFEQNEDVNKLHEKTSKMRLGAVDAFMSHSWKDPGKPKWAAIRAWAKRFKSEQGRMPVIWLDKACIDQEKIEESLAVLPVFLSRCKELLVVAGPSYTQVSHQQHQRTHTHTHTR